MTMQKHCAVRVMSAPWRCLVGILAVTGSLAVASPVTTYYGGNLTDATNSALVGSGQHLAPADFTDPANNVALYHFNLAQAGNVEFTSTGFAAGGAAPYVTLFAGLGAGAGFAQSNYDDAVLGDGGDFDLVWALSAGDYTLAIGAFENLSFAENLGSGTLDDGFIGLGQLLGDGSYAVAVTAGVAGGGGGGGTVAEPPMPALVLAAAFVGLLALRLPGFARVRRRLA